MCLDLTPIHAYRKIDIIIPKGVSNPHHPISTQIRIILTMIIAGEANN